MRVFALYSNNRYVIVFFSMTWLFVLGSHILVPMETIGGNIGPTKYCFVQRTKLGNTLAASSIFFYDFLVFTATSWGFMRNSYSDVNVKNSIRVMVFGRNLPTFSKAILQDGQAYFLWVYVLSLFHLIVWTQGTRLTLVLNFLFLLVCYIPRAPIAPCAIAFPFLIMLNNMSSYVYRNLRFGFYRIRRSPAPWSTTHSNLRVAFEKSFISREQRVFGGWKYRLGQGTEGEEI